MGRELLELCVLGRSGLRVSTLCLGTMTFGTDWGWGSDHATAGRILDRYLEAGGNFVDTADNYTAGESETILGELLAKHGRRARVVVASKTSFSRDKSDPNAGGNGRRNILDAVDGSLRRLKSDWIDLYLLHAWDRMTPVREVVSTMDGLVRTGKIRYWGLSNFPAWYVAVASSEATFMGLEPPIALQVEYSLAERSVEFEHVPAAIESGLGVCAWSPLASGFLTGKYAKTVAGFEGEGRMSVVAGSGNPIFEKFNDRNWQILEAVRSIALERGERPAQVALGWLAGRAGVAAIVVGARDEDQLSVNLAPSVLTVEERLRLDHVSAPNLSTPYHFFDQGTQRNINGSRPIRDGMDGG